MIIGVDPGIKGAICFNKNNSIQVFDIPIKGVVVNKKEKFEYDEKRISTLFKVFLYNVDKNSVKAFIEKQQPFPQQGGVSNFSTGGYYWFWRGFFTGLSIEFELVPAKTWQKAFLISSKHGNTKEQAEKVAKRYYPELELRTKRGKLLDGRCDAICISVYGREVTK